MNTFKIVYPFVKKYLKESKGPNDYDGAYQSNDYYTHIPPSSLTNRVEKLHYYITKLANEWREKIPSLNDVEIDKYVSKAIKILKIINGKDVTYDDIIQFEKFDNLKNFVNNNLYLIGDTQSIINNWMEKDNVSKDEIEKYIHLFNDNSKYISFKYDSPYKYSSFNELKKDVDKVLNMHKDTQNNTYHGEYYLDGYGDKQYPAIKLEDYYYDENDKEYYEVYNYYPQLLSVVSNLSNDNNKLLYTITILANKWKNNNPDLKDFQFDKVMKLALEILSVKYQKDLQQEYIQLWYFKTFKNLENFVNKYSYLINSDKKDAINNWKKQKAGLSDQDIKQQIDKFNNVKDMVWKNNKVKHALEDKKFISQLKDNNIDIPSELDNPYLYKTFDDLQDVIHNYEKFIQALYGFDKSIINHKGESTYSYHKIIDFNQFKNDTFDFKFTTPMSKELFDFLYYMFNLNFTLVFDKNTNIKFLIISQPDSFKDFNIRMMTIDQNGKVLSADEEISDDIKNNRKIFSTNTKNLNMEKIIKYKEVIFHIPFTNSSINGVVKCVNNLIETPIGNDVEKSKMYKQNLKNIITNIEDEMQPFSPKLYKSNIYFILLNMLFSHPAEINYENDLPNGQVIFYYNNKFYENENVGIKKETFDVVNSQKINGSDIFYNYSLDADKNSINHVIYYNNNEPNGYKYLYPSGRKEQTLSVDGIKDNNYYGVLTTYYDNNKNVISGEYPCKIIFNKNKHDYDLINNGTIKEYDDEGKLNYTAKYKDGKKINEKYYSKKRPKK